MRRFFQLAAIAFWILVAVPAIGDENQTAATFAIVIGSNASVDNLPPLKYADDDAARYLDLFRLLGARTYLLTRLDENTRRLHSQAAAEATDPVKANLDAALAQLLADVTKARARNVETVVYFVYAGHGNVENGRGYITLEDARLTGHDLAVMFAKIPADKIHVIADACASYFLAYSRGPGGERRALPEGFGLAADLSSDPRVGLLLSTSSATESHEWDAFQAGVFSHEVRSGLYGAADADHDGKVSYREIAAFVARANAAIPNERFRPDVHAKPPRGGDTLVDLRQAGRRLTIDGAHASHYYIEDARGVRIADFHNASGQEMSIVRPPPNGHAYLRRVVDDREFLLDSAPPVLSMNDLTVSDPRTASRGAAHESFGELFALAFDEQAVLDYKDCDPPAPPPPPTSPASRDVADVEAPARRRWGPFVVAAGGAIVAAGAILQISTSSVRDDNQDASGAHREDINDRIRFTRWASPTLYAVGGVAVATGLVMWLWPTSNVRIAADHRGGFVGYGGSF